MQRTSIQVDDSAFYHGCIGEREPCRDRFGMYYLCIGHDVPWA